MPWPRPVAASAWCLPFLFPIPSLYPAWPFVLLALLDLTQLSSIFGSILPGCCCPGRSFLDQPACVLIGVGPLGSLRGSECFHGAVPTSYPCVALLAPATSLHFYGTSWPWHCRCWFRVGLEVHGPSSFPSESFPDWWPKVWKLAFIFLLIPSYVTWEQGVSVYLPACLPVCLSVHPSTCLSVCVSVIYLSMYLSSLYPSINHPSFRFSW